MESLSTPVVGADGLIHPEDEAAVAALVRFAAAHGRRLRVRGAGHSPPGGFSGDSADDLVLSLGHMRALTVLDLEGRIVEAQAGIHIGADPLAPGEEGAPTQALLNQLADRYGWTVSSTGGISHQALGGFLSTGSAGGSLQHSLLDHVMAVRLIDGLGEVREFRADDDGPGLAGVLPSLGLLGVIVSVTLRCEPMFAIVGQESIVDLEGASIDLEGAGGSGRPSLAEFLTRAEYARIDWWPQRGAERLLIWQAQRVALQPGFRPTRYEEFTRYPILAEALFSTIYVIFGNQTDPARIRQLLRRNAAEVADQLDALAAEGHVSRRRRRRLSVLPMAMRALAAGAPVMRLLRPLLVASLPWLVPAALGTVLPLDDHKRGMQRGEPQSFRDWAWEGLPMDDQANDVLMWTQFIELWVPMTRASELVRVVRDYFAAPADARESYARTGLYAYELYGAPPAAGWIHPGYSDGADEWSEGALRLDIFWFTDNAEDPRERFYPQFWDLLSAQRIPFRSHWGKELPILADYPDLLSDHFSHFQDWLSLRAECDPDGVFLTDYWRERLGLT